LADRIAAGPVAVEDALPIARQIAEALEAAHEQGIVHRDLKPANIKVRPDGTVKVLDFGLAKAMGDDRSVRLQPDVTASPTITSPAMISAAGLILGTTAYMSPEQAAGKPVDKRADVWSFGVILWEMLTGRRLFDGETVPHTFRTGGAINAMSQLVWVDRQGKQSGSDHSERAVPPAASRSLTFDLRASCPATAATAPA
jgi:serine/threonine-protein kinase